MSLQAPLRDPWVTPELFVLSSGNEATFGNGKFPTRKEGFVFVIPCDGCGPDDPPPGDDEAGAS